MAKKNVTVVEEIQEKIIDKPLNQAIHDFMIPYAEYIILDRAIPRVEDGLKPVQRRILYTMYELNLKPEGQYKKSARVVGDCLGKYHPHGDTSVYDAMVKLAQDFKMSQTLVDGQGNFGSIDGDSAAAMRYTEVKMRPLACEMMRDLEKNTVRWDKNFDDSLYEPNILPAAFPNLLVNGADGVAIAVSTSIPPHNLTEVLDGVIAMIDNPNITVEELMKYVKGPDFPTGGYIVNNDAIRQLYETGRGAVTMSCKAHIEPDGTKQNIVITEIPYGIKKTDLQGDIKKVIEKSLKTNKDHLLSGVQSVVDESDRSGIRLVVRLKKGQDAPAILDFLFQKTKMKTDFSANMVAIADSKPQLLNLPSMLRYYILHRKDVIVNRSKFDLKIAEARKHILDGFVIILSDIDGVVALIKGSKSRSDAKDGLRKKYGLSEKQADAILDLKLANLTRLEVTKIETELAELIKKIEALTKIIKFDAEQYKVIRKELKEIRDKYKVSRKTTLIDSEKKISFNPTASLATSGKSGHVVLNMDGSIKFLSEIEFCSARNNPATAPCEMICHSVYSDATKTVLAFTSDGNCCKLNLDTVQEGKLSGKGLFPKDVSPECSARKFISVIVTDANPDGNLLFATKGGSVKRTALHDCIIGKDFYQIFVLNNEDEVIAVEEEKENSALLLSTEKGMILAIDPNEIPITKRKTGGVIGIANDPNDAVAFAETVTVDAEEKNLLENIAVIGSNGYAKRIKGSIIFSGKRSRKGSRVMDLSEGEKIVLAKSLYKEFTVTLIAPDGNFIKINTDQLSTDHTPLGNGKGKPCREAKGCVQAGIIVTEEDS